MRGLPNRHTTRDVHPSEIVGTWNITQDSLDTLKKEGYSKHLRKEDHRIVFAEDGTCQVRTYAYTFFHPTPEDEQYYIQDTGNWKIEKKTTWAERRRIRAAAVEIRITNYDTTVKSHVMSGVTFSLFIEDCDGSIVLWDYIGDPDYTEYRNFTRE